MSPNWWGIDKLRFNFVFLWQVKLIPCWYVKPRLAWLAGNSEKFDEVVDDSFKPEWVQTGEKMMNLHSISCFKPDQANFVSMCQPVACWLTGDSIKVYVVVYDALKPGWVQIGPELTNFCSTSRICARLGPFHVGISNHAPPISLATHRNFMKR